MKKISGTILLTAIFLLTACGKKVGRDVDSSREVNTESVQTSNHTMDVKTESASETAEVTTKEKKKAGKNIPDEVFFETTDNVEVYENLSVAELITNTNAELTEPEKKIKTDELGECSVNISFDYEGISYEKEITYNVSDTTQPIILNMGWSPYTIIDEPFDLSSIVGYADNYDRSPELSYTGEVNTSEYGAYPITATVTDSSGNSTSWDMDVFVVSEIPAPEDNNTRVNFSDFMDYYCYENVSYGIDVSAWQTNVDYEKVKEQGCEFVIMRMGYCYSEIKKDDYYDRNMENASAAGLDIGVYFYTTANTEKKAREQARWIIEQLDGRQLDYPVAFDWEEWGQFQKYGMNIRDLNEIFEAFCDELEKNGYSGMLYSSKNFLNNFWDNKKNRTVWLAHYVDETDYDGEFSIWQASAYGRIEGIDGDVDMNIRLNDMPV